MKSQKKWWLIAGVVVLLLIVGVWAYLNFGPVNRVLSDREAEAYRAYDITLPQGESSAFSYILSQCTDTKEQSQAGGIVFHTYTPQDTLNAAFPRCREILSVELREAEGIRSLNLRYEGTEGEEVDLTYGEDGSLALRLVYFPQRDTLVEYLAESGQTRIQRPFRNRS